MKPFLISLPIFYLALFLTLNLTASLPMPGSEPIPDWVIERELFNHRIFETIQFPGRFFGPNFGFVLAPLIWALLLSLIASFAWRFARVLPKRISR